MNAILSVSDSASVNNNSPSAQRKTVILVLSHVMDKDIIDFFKRIKEECHKYYDIIFLCDNTKNVFSEYKDADDFYLFTMEQLQSLGYPGKTAITFADETRESNPFHKNFNFIPGSTDLPVLCCYRDNAAYDYYWIIEYDVRYSGSWRRFFANFAGNEADLLGTTLTHYHDVPNWYHWPSLDLLTPTNGKDDHLRGFFPVYRLSNRALAQLDREYRRGVGGHYECLVPTVLYRAGMTIEDIGGDGKFVRPENHNRFYRNTPTAPSLGPGTFVFRPIMDRAGCERDTLWHPVKYSPAWRVALRQGKRLIGRIPGVKAAVRLLRSTATPQQEHSRALDKVEEHPPAGRQQQQDK